MHSKSRVALIELGQGHYECLYSQFRYLKDSGHEPYLVVPEQYKNRVPYAEDDFAFFIPNIGQGVLSDWSAFRQIRDYLRHNHIDYVVFNTAEGKQIRNLAWCLREFQLSGVLHNTKKLHASWMQWQISQLVQRYYVLADYLLDCLPQKYKDRVQSFYPLCFYDEGVSSLNKPDDELWICIPGQVEYKRRDYDSLIHALTSIRSATKLKFILLGNGMHAHGDLPELIQTLKAKGLEDHFVWFDGFVSDQEYLNYIQASDLVMPLIHPELSQYAEYRTTKVSAAFLWAFGLKKPLLISRAYVDAADFDVSSIFYDPKNLAVALSQLNSDEIVHISQVMIRHNAFLANLQAEKYHHFLSSD